MAAEEMEQLLVRGRIGPGEAPSHGLRLDVREFRFSGDAAHPPVTEGRATVLVVGSSASERRLLHTYLEESGSFHVVGEAPDAPTAITLAQRTKPDVVLLDMAMRGTEGFEALPRLLRASPTSRGVVLSRSVTRDLRASAVAAGATAVLDKARSLGSIADELNRLVASRTAGNADGERIG